MEATYHSVQIRSRVGKMLTFYLATELLAHISRFRTVGSTNDCNLFHNKMKESKYYT